MIPFHSFFPVFFQLCSSSESLVVLFPSKFLSPCPRFPIELYSLLPHCFGSSLFVLSTPVSWSCHIRVLALLYLDWFTRK